MCRTRLRDLDLSHNCLTSVRNVDWLPSLATLDLSANQISSLESPASLISSRALKLSGNRLESFDARAFSSVSLLYVDQNHLPTVTGLKNRQQSRGSVSTEQSPSEKRISVSPSALIWGLSRISAKCFCRLTNFHLKPSLHLLHFCVSSFQLSCVYIEEHPK